MRNFKECINCILTGRILVLDKIYPLSPSIDKKEDI